MDGQLDKCVWMWAGLLTYRLCDRNYRCDGCPVENLFRHAEGTALEPARLSAGNPPPAAPRSSDPDRFHDAQHVWLRVLPGECVQVGLDPLAARLLVPSDSVTLPPVGTRLPRGGTAATFALGGESIDFASPLAGEVLRTHKVRHGRVRSMLSHPYSRAWLLILSVPRLGKQLSGFLFGRSAGLCLAHEWLAVQEECLGLAALTPGMPGALPDGGELDLARLSGTAGPSYPRLVRRWIGKERIQAERPGTRASAGERANRGGVDSPPEGR